MKADNLAMESVADLIWTAEEEIDLNAGGSDNSIMANCGGGGKSGCVACCCTVPSLVTKWLCPNGSD